MGLREKVTLTLVIIALIQIACRHCMPRTPRKASFKQYLNDLKPIKNPVPTPYSPARINKTPKQTFGKTAQNGRISQNSLPKKSLYKTYNFPENEYPLDNSPRDPFRIGMNFNDNNHVNTLQKSRNLQSSAINDLKREMKMKRKLLSYKQVNNENRQLKTDVSLIKFAPSPDSIRSLDSKTFPEVQYPLNTMDTWGPNYWNYLPFTQEKPFHRFGQQTFNPKVEEDINKPFTRMTKARASKYLQPYDKLKEEHRRTSTENSKRSNVGQRGLNFTKTATCERVSDDFITAGLVSNIPSISTEIKKPLTSTKIISSENTCPVTENPYHPLPIPYKVIEENTENICPTHESKNKTKVLQDVDNSVIAQTLQLIQEILLNDDTSLTVLHGNYSKEIEKNMTTSDYAVVSANEDVSIPVMNSAKIYTESLSEELSQKVSDDALAGNLRHNMTSLQAELILKNNTTDPLNARTPLPFSEPTTYEALTNALSSVPKPLSNGNAVPASASIIIIPFNNNAVGMSQSHIFGTSPETPIIVYLPSTQSNDASSQPSPFNQIVSLSLDNTVPNNQSHNFLSNIAPLQNDSPYSNTLVSELLNSNSDSGSSLAMSETLPTYSMCYNNESSPLSMREKPILDILKDKSLADDAPFVTIICDEKFSEQPIGTGDLDVNTNTLPPISDFEQPLFDFSGSEFTSLSHGSYNNVLNTELPIISREIDSDQQILNVSSKDLFIPTQNVTSEHLHKTASMNSDSEVSLSEIPIDVPPVALNKNFSSVTPTDSMEIQETNTLVSESIPNLQEHVDTFMTSRPEPIDKILLTTPLIEPPSAELLQPKESSLSPTLLSETLSDKITIIMDTKLPLKPVLDTTTESPPQYIGDNSMMTDMTVKTELYKIRQILDKMLSTETPTYSQPPIDSTLLPTVDSDNLLQTMNKPPNERLPVSAVYKTLLPLGATDSPIDSLRQLHETYLPIPVFLDTLPLPGNKLVIPNKILETDIPSLPINETDSPTLESATSADDKPYLLDNLVTPLSETVTSHIKVTSTNGLSYKIDDLPLKMDLKFPDIYEVSNDNLPSVDDLPIQVHPISTNDLPMQVVETLTPVSEIPVSDLPKPIDVLSLPVYNVLGALPDVPTDSVKTLLSGSIEKLLQDCPSPKVPFDGLPNLSLNVFKSSIRETFADGQSTEISSTDNLPLSVQKLFPGLSLSDALAYEPSLKDYTPPLVIDKDIDIASSTADNKNLPQGVERQSTNQDKTSDKVLSDLIRDGLPVPEDKMLPFSNNKPNNLSLPMNRTSSTSKLRIAKVLLENVLSDVTKGGLSSLADKYLPNTQHSQLDKTFHDVEVKSSLSETKEIPLRPVEKIFLNSEHTNNLIDYVPFSEKLVGTSITEQSELPLPLDEIHRDKPYIPTDDVVNHDKNKTQPLGNSIHGLPMRIDKVPSPKDTTKTTSSSKLPITKALLENVLSDITSRGFSIPVAQSLTVPPPSLLNKTLYYFESNISHITKDSPSLAVDKILPNILLSNSLPVSTEDTFPLPIDKTFSELQRLDIPTELTLPIDKIRPDVPNISMYDKEQDEGENSTTENFTDELSSVAPMEGLLSFSKDTPSDLTLPKNKTPSSSNLPITKALLENVLSDINTRGFSLPVAKAHPVTSRSQLDKTLYFLEFPVSDMTEKSSVIPTENFPFSGTNEDVFPRPTDKTLPDNPMLDVLTDLLLTDKNHNSVILTDDVDQEDESDILSGDEERSDKSYYFTENAGDKDEDKSDILTNAVKQEDKSDILTDGIEQEDKSDILPDDVEQEDKSDILTDGIEQEDKSDILPDDVEQEDKSDILPDDVEQEDKSDILTHGIEQEEKSEILTDDIEQEDKSDILSDGIEQEDKSVILTDGVEQEDKSDILTDGVEQEDKSDILTDGIEQEDKSDILTDDLEQEDKSDILSDNEERSDKSDYLTENVEDEDEDKCDILSNDEEDSDKFDNLTYETEIEDSSESLVLDDPPVNMPGDVRLTRTKPYLTSRIPITKALLEKVLSDITDGGIHP